MLTNSAPRPSMTTRASAVTTSWRARRPRNPMPSAPPTANTASPQMTLMPSRLAPAAPAKAPLGIAWAANVDPRSTAKNPVIPAMTATTDAAIQVFIIRALNMSPLRSPGGPREGRRRGGGKRTLLAHPQRCLPAVDGGAALGFLVRRAGHRAAAGPGVAEQVGRQHQDDHEERDRPAVTVRRP